MRRGGEGDWQVDCGRLVGDDCIRGCGERAEEGVILLRDLVLAAGPLGGDAYESSMTWP